ncbi:MAG: hypothetical protein CTY39_10890 [Hyphomicrobium sp.]|nr:MAG: hypothetical protein CTY39_10890 [Hyphomicrobium sp.]
MTTIADVKTHKASGAWRQLETLATEIVADASRRAKSDLKPVLGGGARLMLIMEHRISDDIDLFIRDPQWIGYLTPRLNDRFENMISGYDEGATSLKLRLPHGEIDFIVSMSLLGLPNEASADCAFALEPVAEVLAKKLFYRGWALTPRDLLDWRMIETKLPPSVTHAPLIAKLVARRIDQIHAALTGMDQSAKAQLVWAGIRAPELPDFHETIQWAQAQLIEFRRMNLASEQAPRNDAIPPELAPNDSTASWPQWRT